MSNNKRNPAYGEWSEEETNWSDKDTKFLEDTLDNKEISITSKELIEQYGTLSTK